MKARPGVVLMLALLCIVALELAVAALHFTALQQLRAARAGSRSLQLRLAAQSAAAAAVAGWPRREALQLPVGGRLDVVAAAGSAPGGIISTASAERLDSTLFLVRGEARSPLGERARAGYLLVAGPPALQVPAALQATGPVSLEAGAVLRLGSPECPLTSDPSLALRLPRADQLHSTAGARLEGPLRTAEELAGASLEEQLALPIASLLQSATHIPVSSLTPEPRSEAGRCLTELSSNWGEPSPMAGGVPCGAWLPQLARAGDLTINGGRGQGLLYVAGDLALTAGASFSGLVLVGGSLTLGEASSIDGAVLVAGPVRIANGAVVGNPCTLRSALEAVPGLSGPFRTATRSWLPLF